MTQLVYRGDFNEQCENLICPRLKDFFMSLLDEGKVHLRKVNLVVIGSKGKPISYNIWNKEYYSKTVDVSENEIATLACELIGPLKNILTYKKFLRSVRNKIPDIFNIHYIHLIVEIDPIHPMYLGKRALVVDIKSDKFTEPTSRGIGAFMRRKDKSNDNVQILVEVDDPEGLFGQPRLREVA